MFGYVLPNGQTLSRRDFAMFQSVYCGICLATKEKYGNLARLTTNFDMTVLELLLIEAIRPRVAFGTCRCVGDPRKKPFLRNDAVLRRVVDANILLCAYKIADDETDGGGKHRMMRSVLKKPFAAAKAALPAADDAIRAGYARLRDMEKANVASVDRVADCFAKLLEELAVALIGDIISDPDAYYNTSESAEDAAARLAEGSEYMKHFRALCYNIGKFVYLADALDDLADDRKTNNYNPFLAVYPDYGKDGKAGFVARHGQELKFAFVSTVNRAIECCNRLPLTQVGDLLKNVIYEGLRIKTEELLAAKKKLPPPRLRIPKARAKGKETDVPEGKGV